MLATITILLITLGIFLLSALPLYISVRFLGGETGLLKVILVNLVVGLVAFAINSFFTTWAGLLAFILMLLIYKEFFKLGWIRALIAWLLQFVFAGLIVLLAVVLFGVNIALF